MKAKDHTRLYSAMKVIGGAIGRLLAAGVIVFALSTLFDMVITRLPNTGGVIEFKVSIGDLKNQATSVIPGKEQAIDTSLINKSGQVMYMFLRLDCATYDEGDEKLPIYSYTPEADTGWTQVTGVGKDGQIVFAWTENEVLKTVNPQEELPVIGILKCVVPIKAFESVDDFAVDFSGLGISTDENNNPVNAYKDSIEARNN